MNLFYALPTLILGYRICDLFAHHYGKCETVKKIFGDHHSSFYKFFCERFVSTIHASLASLFATLCLLDIIHDQSVINGVFINSMAFTLYDMYIMIYPSNKEKDKHMIKFMVHHIVMCLILFLNYETSDTNKTKLILRGLNMEWSTIFLNISIILYKSGYGSTLYFKINSWMTILTYVVFRLVLFTLSLYEIYQISILYVLLASIFCVLNFIWFGELVGHHWSMAVKNKIKKVA